MRKRGVEPLQPFSHMLLKHACLPFHHFRLKMLRNHYSVGKIGDQEVLDPDQNGQDFDLALGSRTLDEWYWC